MKGDRRQHGGIINEPLLAQQRYTKMVEDSTTATRLFNKPINQSKCAGKCHKGRCSASGHHHKHAVCKSRDKTKGAMKMKMRSMNPENEWTKYPVGNSATRVLAYLANQEGHNDYDYDYDYEGRVEETYDYNHAYDHDHDDDDDDGTHAIDLFGGGFAIGIGIVVDEHENDVDVDDDDDGIDDDEFDDDDDDAMSFCDVGLCWGHEDGDEYGEDGWYLVGGEME